jgi:hydrogenase maturation protease
MIVVIGIGQSLRGDDAAGLAAVRLWQENYLVDAQSSTNRVELVENPGLGLLTLLEDAVSAILVDAVQSGAEPGTLHCLCEADIGAFLDGTGSAHGWGVAETLSLGRKIYPENLPTQLVLIGIEAENTDLGESLSPKVEATLTEAARLIEVMRKKFEDCSG